MYVPVVRWEVFELKDIGEEVPKFILIPLGTYRRQWNTQEGAVEYAESCVDKTMEFVVLQVVRCEWQPDTKKEDRREECK